jgi:uncharacterized membrane protein
MSQQPQQSPVIRKVLLNPATWVQILAALAWLAQAVGVAPKFPGSDQLQGIVQAILSYAAIHYHTAKTG